jgi:UDP-2,4-diacetamido-2,4,6-trideoxy-beta-L-altropyranose hydrolase
MQIVFRVDASASIGHGHVMRCLTLADTLRKKGASVRFLCREETGHAIPLIQKKDFEVCVLFPGDAPLSPAEDAKDCLKLLNQHTDLLIVDHYQLDAAWERNMRTAAKWIMVIDDLANRPHDCDLLLDQNLLPDATVRYQEKVPEHCRQLLGTNYVLLEPVYQKTSRQCAVRQTLQNILVFFGGGDAGNMTCRALRELEESDASIDVVIGNAHPYPDEVRELCSANGWQLHVQTRRMAELIAKADLAIGAGGTSHWERTLLGLPSIVIAIAENQYATSEMLAERGACRYLGPADTLPDGAIRSAVESFRTTPSSLHTMSQAAFDVVPDGNGCYRVAEAIEGLLLGD